MSLADAMRDRMELDAAALSADADALRVLHELGAGDLELEELMELDAVLEAVAAAAPFPPATPRVLDLLELEVVAWLRLLPEELALQMVERLPDGPPTSLRGRVAYRRALDDVRRRTRAACEGEEVGWLGGLIAEPADIAARLEQTETEVTGILHDLDMLDEEAQALDAVLDFRDWADEWTAWHDSGPSTFWGSTLTDLDEWDAQLAGQRARLERALGEELATESPERQGPPLEAAAEQGAQALADAASGIGWGVGAVLGLALVGLGVYAYSKGARR